MDHISHLQLLRIFKTDNARETKPAFPYLTDYLQSTEHICDLYICQLKLLEPKETKCLLQLPRPVHIIRKLSVCSLETNSNCRKKLGVMACVTEDSEEKTVVDRGEVCLLDN